MSFPLYWHGVLEGLSQVVLLFKAGRNSTVGVSRGANDMVSDQVILCTNPGMILVSKGV
jgi:hypothetical protein